MKCYFCKKNINLMNFECKCKKKFCVNCLLPETHNCTFNFRQEGKKILENKLEKIDSNKIIKI